MIGFLNLTESLILTCFLFCFVLLNCCVICYFSETESFYLFLGSLRTYSNWPGRTNLPLSSLMKLILFVVQEVKMKAKLPAESRLNSWFRCKVMSLGMESLSLSYAQCYSKKSYRICQHIRQLAV